jgi:hypothetical protein
MDPTPTTRYVAECFWAGVTEDDLRALDRRATATVATLAASGESVRYLGSMLVRQDEVVLCLFEGSVSSVRMAAEQAGIPFERLLEATAMGRLQPPEPRQSHDGSSISSIPSGRE